jgi:hypothetical protein
LNDRLNRNGPPPAFGDGVCRSHLPLDQGHAVANTLARPFGFSIRGSGPCRARLIELRQSKSMLRLRVYLAVTVLALAAGAAHADLSVLIDTRSQSTEQFLVIVHTRHADLHNGYSRERFKGLVPANQRTRIQIDFYVSLVGHGVSAYHPDYTFESAVTNRRSDALPTLTPRRWEVILQDLDSLPLYGQGATYLNILGHVMMYRDQYIAALDRAGIDPDPAALPRLRALLEKADALVRFPPETPTLQNYHYEMPAKRARVLPDIEKLLALKRSQRLAMVAFRELTIGPKPMLAALEREQQAPSLQAFLTSVHERKPAPRLPQEHAWQDRAGLRLAYRIDDRHQEKRDRQLLDCFRGSVTFDGRPAADAEFEDLVKKVEARFCLEPDGQWRIRRP